MVCTMYSTRLYFGLVLNFVRYFGITRKPKFPTNPQNETSLLCVSVCVCASSTQIRLCAFYNILIRIYTTYGLGYTIECAACYISEYLNCIARGQMTNSVPSVKPHRTMHCERSPHRPLPSIAIAAATYTTYKIVFRQHDFIE